MRYARPKPSIVLATIAIVAVASPLVVSVSKHDPELVDRTTKVADTTIEQVPLRDLSTVVLDMASSGLGAAGIKLPKIDPNQFPLPDLTVPLPSGLVPTATPSDSSSTSTSTSPTETSTTSSATDSTSSTSDSTSTTDTTTSTTTTSATPTSTTTSTTSGTPRSTARARAPQPRMADGRPVGAAVTTLRRSTPIKMLAFTWDRPVDVDMFVRAKRPNGRWGAWTALEQAAGSEASPDHPAGTEPIWVGNAREVQIAATDNGLAIPAAEPQGGGPAQLAMGSASEIITKLVTTALSAIKATLISPESVLSLGSSLLTPLLGGPSVVARAQWGADEAIRCSQPTFSPTVRGAILHHTAGSNEYTAAQSVEIVRGIYAYHARTLNWCDIGYNVLVDKYGQIFEGAFGGLDRNVEGTHTGGFNKSTVGVSMIGNLDQTPPTGAMVAAVARFLRWRLGKAGLNPGGTANLTSEGFSGSKFPAGAQTTLPMIAGHRDYNSTSCPGTHGYSALAQIRGLAGGASVKPPESTPSATPTNPVPVPSA
ncbi:N-acetylmuramoyl-L-alanine amidase [Gordonia sp. NPDC003585]|uniref:peptidoglycan recognition protein family protein n=1 Tax=Gordonia sp. NPDC003585 TaxID=3154275 RepID=UPI0033B2D68A